MNMWSSAMLLGGGVKGFHGKARIFRGRRKTLETGLPG